MKSGVRLLAIVGSQRMDGNSYSLVQTVLESADVDYEIVQLADRRIDFCNLCEKCIDRDCVLKDDFREIFRKMKRADGIVFSVPKYIFVASKYLCFLERLDTINHMQKHAGYERTFKKPEYRLFQETKPFCMLIASGSGNVEKQTVKMVSECIEGLGLRLTRHDKSPFFGACVRAGDRKGEVLDNKSGIDECRGLVGKLVDSIKSSGFHRHC